MAKNTVVVSVTSNVKGLQKGFGSAQSTLAKFGKVAAVVTAAVAAATVAIGVKAVKSASQLEQAMGGMESVFKDSSGQMEKWANAAADSVGLAKSEYAQLSTILGAQLKNMGVSTDKLAGQTNELVGLGADLAATFGGTTSDAVSALSSLLRGERDPIERYGVSLKQVDINARLAEKGMTGLTGEALKQATAIVTLELLYEQTADAQGQFARESTTLAGAQQRLSAGLENLSATFGTALLPAATAVTAALGSLLNTLYTSEWFASLTASVTEASNSFADFIFKLLNGEKSLAELNLGQLLVDQFLKLADWLAGGGLETIFTTLAASREKFLDAMLEALPGIVDAIVTIVPAALKALLDFVVQGASLLIGAAPKLVDAAIILIDGLVEAVIEAIPAVIEAVVDLVPPLLQAAVKLFSSLVDAIPVILPKLVNAVVTLLPTLVTAIVGMIPQIILAAIQLFTSLVEALPVVLPMLVTAIVELLPVIVESLFSMLPAIFDAAIDLFVALVEAIPVIIPLLIQAIFDLLPVLITTIIGLVPKLFLAAIDLFIALVEAIPKIIPPLIQAFNDLGPVIGNAIIKLIPKLIEGGNDMMQGLINGLIDTGGKLGSSLIKIAQDAIGGFLSFLGIKSPSRLFMGFGDNLGQGLALGIDKSGKTVSKALDGMSSLVSDGFNASMTAPEMSLAVSGSGSAAGKAQAAPVYNVYLNTLNPTAETGRVIVQSIRDYEKVGGRL